VLVRVTAKEERRAVPNLSGKKTWLVGHGGPLAQYTQTCEWHVSVRALGREEGA
jgi:hypothetical protein